MRRPNVIAAWMLGAVASLHLGGCFVAGLASAMGQNFEYQKLVEVPAQYAGLEGHTVAVVVQADYATLYAHPTLVQQLMYNISQRIAMNVPNVQVAPTQAVLLWQYRTPQWEAMPLGELAETMNVQRLVHVDVYEYRLHPPGNSWLWEGAVAADVGIIEADGFDPDSFVETFTVQATFPDVKGVGRESASAAQIETGLLTMFVQKAAWLFYFHHEPKYPDKYEGPPPT